MSSLTIRTDSIPDASDSSVHHYEFRQTNKVLTTTGMSSWSTTTVPKTTGIGGGVKCSLPPPSAGQNKPGLQREKTIILDHRLHKISYESDPSSGVTDFTFNEVDRGDCMRINRFMDVQKLKLSDSPRVDYAIEHPKAHESCKKLWHSDDSPKSLNGIFYSSKVPSTEATHLNLPNSIRVRSASPSRLESSADDRESLLHLPSTESVEKTKHLVQFRNIPYKGYNRLEGDIIGYRTPRVEVAPESPAEVFSRKKTKSQNLGLEHCNQSLKYLTKCHHHAKATSLLY